jgi:O-antigen/teichoic acid export membrane protein
MSRLRIRILAADRAVAVNLARYCLGLTVWSFGAFLVNGMDLAVVGHFEFSSVGYYAVATVLITCYIGFGAAIINALLTPVTALYASGDIARIRTCVLLATRWTVAVNAVLALLIAACGKPLLAAWAGDAYAQPAFTILTILVAAQAVRFIGAAFCIMLVATDQQHHGIAGAIVEGVVSLIASVAGAVWLGATGVALGTLIGTLAGFAWMMMRTMPRAQAVPLARSQFIVDGVIRPLLCCLPLGFCMLVTSSTQQPILGWLLPVALILTCCLAFRLGNLFPQQSRIPG